MLIKPYTTLDDEQRNPYALRYIGVVADNNDPEKRKRVKVQIDPWSYLDDEALPWVKQDGDGAVGCSPDESNHHIPEIGAEVTVFFKNGDPNDPVYTGVETTEANRCSLFDEGYPNSYGTKDKVGNYEIVNKGTKTTVRQYASGTTVRSEEDGTYTIETKDGTTVVIDGDGTVKIQGSKINIHADDDIDIRATRINITGTNQVNIGGNNVVVGGILGTQLGGGTTVVGSKSSVSVKAPEVTVENLKVVGGASGFFIDLTSPTRIFTFHNGILTGVGL